MMDFNMDLRQWFIIFFYKKSSGGAVKLAWSEILATWDKSAIMSNQKLDGVLHKPIFSKFEKRKVYSSYNKVNKVFRFLWYIIYIYRKYVWVVSLKYEKRITVTNAFQKLLNESNHKPKKHK